VLQTPSVVRGLRLKQEGQTPKHRTLQWLASARAVLQNQFGFRLTGTVLWNYAIPGASRTRMRSQLLPLHLNLNVPLVPLHCNTPKFTLADLPFDATLRQPAVQEALVIAGLVYSQSVSVGFG